MNLLLNIILGIIYGMRIVLMASFLTVGIVLFISGFILYSMIAFGVMGCIYIGSKIKI